MRPLIKKAVEETYKQSGVRMPNYDLIDSTLKEIGKGYKPGLIRWIRHDSGRWREFLALEDRINQAALSKDEPGLKDALRRYHLFFEEMLKLYEASNIFPLFGRKDG